MSAMHGSWEVAERHGMVMYLESFNLPEFPAESSEQETLTLLSRIKLDNNAYHHILQRPFSIPEMPSIAKSLALNDFAMGYPPGFLVQLSQKLPNLERLILSFQLFAGMTEATMEDSLAFITNLKKLRHLNLLDVMPTLWLKPGFFASIGRELASRVEGLKRLTISFTAHEPIEEFLQQVPYNELAHFITPSLRMLYLTLSPENEDRPPVGQPIPLEIAQRSGVITALLEDDTAPTKLQVLNLSLFIFSIDQLVSVLRKHTSLLSLTMWLYLVPQEEPKRCLLEAMSRCASLEDVTIIYFPSLDCYRAVSRMALTSKSELKLENADARKPRGDLPDDPSLRG